jgi:hypothetical protein
MQNAETSLPARIVGRKSRGFMLILALIMGATSLSLGGCNCTDSSGQQIQCPSEEDFR